MQNNIQQRISGLLNAYKRNRRWKILTIVLSVAVLCNTFYAMRQAAVAVTQNSADETAVADVIGHDSIDRLGSGENIDFSSVLNSSSDTADTGSGNSSQTGDGEGNSAGTGDSALTEDTQGGEGTGSEGAQGEGGTGSEGGQGEGETGTGAGTGNGTTEDATSGTENGATEGTTSGTENTSTEGVTPGTDNGSAEGSTDAAGEGGTDAGEGNTDQGETGGDALTGGLDGTVGDGTEGADAATDASAPEGDTLEADTDLLENPDDLLLKKGLFETRDAATRAGGQQLPYVRVESLDVRDPKENVTITEAGPGDPVKMVLSWTTNTWTSEDYLFAEGNYIEIQLPKDFGYSQVLEQKFPAEATYNRLTGNIPAGGVGTVSITGGDKLRFTFGPSASNVYRNQAMYLFFPGFSAVQTSTTVMTVELIGVSAPAVPGETFKPEAYSTAGYYSNVKAYGSEIYIKDNSGGNRLTDVRITNLRVNGANHNEVAEVGIEDVVKLDVMWEWGPSQTHALANGDHFDVELPEQLTYSTFKQYAKDLYNNLYSYEVRERDSKYILRITFEDIEPGATVASGYAPIYDCMVNRNVVKDIPTAGKSVTLTAKIGGGNSALSTTMKVYRESPVYEDGDWRLRIGDKSTGGSSVLDRDIDGYTCAVYAPTPLGQNGTNSVSLFVIADHGRVLYPSPFWDQYTVDFKPWESSPEYFAAYCADSQARHPQVLVNNFNEYNYAAKFNLISLESAFAYDNDKINEIKRIMARAFPYVDLETMAKLTGEDSISEAEAMIAVQMAIWRVTNGRASYNYNFSDTNGNTYDGDKITRIAAALAANDLAPDATYMLQADQPTVNPDGSVTVTGKVIKNPAGGSFSGLKGKFWSSSSSEPAEFTVKSNGTFTATLYDARKTDAFDLAITGAKTTSVNVLYFDHIEGWTDDGGFIKEDNDQQDLIAAEVCTMPITLSDHWDGLPVDIRVRVIKEWLDETGNPTDAPDGVTVTLNLYRKSQTEKKTLVESIMLSKELNGFSWERTLAKEDRQGNPYTYLIEEAVVPEGFTVSYSDPVIADGTQITLTACNRKFSEPTEVAIIKRWEPESNEIVNAQVALYRLENGVPVPMYAKDIHRETIDGEIVITAEAYSTSKEDGTYEPAEYALNSLEGWKVRFKNLPKKDSNGKLIQYVVVEKSFTVGSTKYTVYPPEDWSTGKWTVYNNSTQQIETGFVVTIDQPDPDAEEQVGIVHNTKQGTLVVVKKWTDIHGNEWNSVFPHVVLIKLAAKKDGNLLTDEQLQAYLGSKVAIEINLYDVYAETGEWRYAWSGLPMNGMEYFVTEVKVQANANNATNNYEWMDGVFGETWITPEKQEDGVYVVELTNQRKPVEIEIIKTDETGEKKLPGVEFALYMKNEQQPITTKTTDDAGKIRFENLAHNTEYTLMEVNSVPGYVPETKPIGFRIVISNGQNKVELLEGPEYATSASVASYGTTLALKIINTAITYVLPEAGGTGTQGYITGGMSLIMATILMYSVLRMLQSRQTSVSGTKEPAVMRKKRKRGASKY